MIQTLIKELRFWLAVYWFIMSLIGFIQFGIDKKRAINKKWRISESTLLWTAVLGGSVGSILGMKAFHHKTLHRKFSVSLPLILLVQVILIAAFWYLTA